MSSNSEPHVKDGGATRVYEVTPQEGRAGLRRVGLSAAGCRLPSFFLLVTLRFPGWRGTIPIVFPLFVLEDLLESAGYLMSVLFFLCPALSQKARVDLGKGGRSLRGAAAEGGHWSYGQDLCADTSGPTLEHGQKRERFSIEFGPSWLFALARIVRTLRYQGRFTLVEVSEGSSGTEIAVRLV